MERFGQGKFRIFKAEVDTHKVTRSHLVSKRLSH